MAAQTVGGNATVAAPVQVAMAGGVGILALMMSVMMLSGSGVLDSTFSSTSKAVVVDLIGAQHSAEGSSGGTLAQAQSVLLGRMSMVAIAVLGNLPMLLGTAKRIFLFAPH